MLHHAVCVVLCVVCHMVFSLIISSSALSLLFLHRTARVSLHSHCAPAYALTRGVSQPVGWEIAVRFVTMLSCS